MLKQLNRKDLRAGLDYALRFRKTYKIPLYVGEFTAHRNPSTTSGTNYLGDLLDIMNAEGCTGVSGNTIPLTPGWGCWPAMSRGSSIGRLSMFSTITCGS